MVYSHSFTFIELPSLARHSGAGYCSGMMARVVRCFVRRVDPEWAPVARRTPPPKLKLATDDDLKIAKAKKTSSLALAYNCNPLEFTESRNFSHLASLGSGPIKGVPEVIWV